MLPRIWSFIRNSKNREVVSWLGGGAALTMRPAALSSGIDKDRADYTVFCGEWNIGRIYEVRGGPDQRDWLP